MIKQAISDDSGPDVVADYFNVSRESLSLLREYEVKLVKWQKRINLVGPKELARLWPRHIADGLQLTEFVPATVRKIVDIGSGGGIPGVVLAIVLRGKPVEFHLIESNAKKAAFLREVVRDLDLLATVHCRRIEDTNIQNVDLVTARALAPLPTLMGFAEKLLKNSGELLLLKGLDVVTELTETTKYWNITCNKHVSRVNSQGCVLNIKDFNRVAVPKS